MRTALLLMMLMVAIHHPTEIVVDLANVGAVAAERLLQGDFEGAWGAL
jgi:hypothetical protein